jgi:hypothetical protein
MTTESRVQLSPEDRAELEGWVAGRNTPQKLVWRARIVLMWADGAGITKIVQATSHRNSAEPLGDLSLITAQGIRPRRR